MSVSKVLVLTRNSVVGLIQNVRKREVLGGLPDTVCVPAHARSNLLPLVLAFLVNILVPVMA